MAPPKSHLTDLCVARGLAPPVEAWFAPAEGVMLRYAHWQTVAPTKGAVLFLNGRTEFIEKEIETYGDLLAGGFDIWTFDWRGQGLSHRLLAERHKGHIESYQDYLNDLHVFVTQVTDLTRRQDQRIMIGHSMGGHIGLRFLHDHPGLVDRAVFSAPMVDLAVNCRPIRGLIKILRKAGLGACYAPRQGPYRPWFVDLANPANAGTVDDYRLLAKEISILSHDARRVMEIDQCVRQNPALGIGGPTIAWVDATLESIQTLLSRGYVERIQTPCLMIGGGRDRIVITAAQHALARRMPHARSVQVDHASHELLMECDDIRGIFFKETGAWIGTPFELEIHDMSGCLHGQAPARERLSA